MPNNLPPPVGVPRLMPVQSSSSDVNMALGFASGGQGFIVIIVGFIIALWARSHSPYMGFMEMATKAAQDPEYGVMREPYYTILIAIAFIIGLIGFIALVIGLVYLAMAFAKKN